MDLALIPLAFILILIAELPDKSMFASLVLGTKFAPRWVFLGIATAFLVHVVIAVTAGGLLTLAPHRVVEIIVTVLFVLGAFLLWRESMSDEEEEEGEAEAEGTTAKATRLAAFGTSFGVIFIGEWGDLTQILTANLAAKYHDPVAIGIGATLGLWTAAILAITLGRTLLQWISMTLLQRIGAVILLGFAVYTVVQIIQG